jgi:hypothetical protein
VHVAGESEVVVQEKTGGIRVDSLPAASEFTETDILAIVYRTQEIARRIKWTDPTERAQHHKEHRRAYREQRAIEQGKPVPKPRVVKPVVTVACAQCGKPTTSGKYCSQACVHKAQNKIRWPTTDRLKELVWSTPTSVLAKQLGVSDKAIDKRCKKLGVEKPPRGYWAKQKALTPG